MTAQVPHHAIGGDRIPAGPLDLDDHEHRLLAVHFGGQAGAPATAPDEPPRAFPESRYAGEPGQEG